jgi:hypothetical protein
MAKVTAYYSNLAACKLGLMANLYGPCFDERALLSGTLMSASALLRQFTSIIDYRLNDGPFCSVYVVNRWQFHCEWINKKT